MKILNSLNELISVISTELKYLFIENLKLMDNYFKLMRVYKLPRGFMSKGPISFIFLGKF